MPSPHHGGAPLHANAPTLAKVTLRRAARVHRDAPLCQRSTPPHEASQEPIHGASYLVSWPQPSAIPPRAYPQRLVPRAPRATALGRPRQEPIHSTSRIVPTGHSPSAVPPGAYPRRLVPRVPDHTAISRPPGAYPQRLVPCAPGHHTLPAYGCDLSLPALDAACLHPNSTIAAGLASRHPNRTLPYRMQPYCTQLTYSRRHHLAPTQSSATYDRRTSL